MLKQTTSDCQHIRNANLMIQIGYMEVSNTGVGIGGGGTFEGGCHHLPFWRRGNCLTLIRGKRSLSPLYWCNMIKSTHELKHKCKSTPKCRMLMKCHVNDTLHMLPVKKLRISYGYIPLPLYVLHVVPLIQTSIQSYGL